MYRIRDTPLEAGLGRCATAEELSNEGSDNIDVGDCLCVFADAKMITTSEI